MRTASYLNLQLLISLLAPYIFQVPKLSQNIFEPTFCWIEVIQYPNIYWNETASFILNTSTWINVMSRSTRKPVGGFMQSCRGVKKMASSCLIYQTFSFTSQINSRDPGKYFLSDLPDQLLLLVKLIADTQANTCLSCLVLWSTTPGVMHTSSAHARISSACTHVIHTSSAALLLVSVGLNYLSTVTGTGYWMEFVARMLSSFISGSCKWFVR